jgi:hypothetical protein
VPFVFTEEASSLYSQGYSAAEIGQKLKCSPHKVAYWLKKSGTVIRSRSEALYRKYNPEGDPFSIKKIKTLRDAHLMGLGLGIYWGEGNKVSPNAVRVTNSDSKVILAFLRFLDGICGVKKEKIKFNLICFNDSNIDEVKTYWSEVLQVSSEKFGKIVKIPPQGKGSYRRKSQFGVCTVGVYNMRLKQWLMKTLESY